MGRTRLLYAMILAVLVGGIASISPAPAGADRSDSGISGAGADAITAGDYHACALKAGAVTCWGRNNLGQLGNNSTTDSPTPIAVPGMVSGVTAIAAGGYHTCALQLGSVWCWGWNVSGQLGNDSQNNTTVPFAVTGMSSGVTAIAAGYAHTCAIKDGAAYCWGGNVNMQLGRGPVPGNTLIPALVSGMNGGVTALSGGERHTCGIRDGAALCWGSNAVGQLGFTPPSEVSSNVPGAVDGMGSGVTEIAAGYDHTCAVRDGGAWCWGQNANGALGNDTTDDSVAPVQPVGLAAGVSSIGVGDDQSCAVQDGAAWCWGRNYQGSLGIGSTTGPDTCPSVLGGCSMTPVALAGLPTGVTSIRGGGANASNIYHTCALRDGAPWCWGSNAVGQLGDPGAGGSTIVPFAITASIPSGPAALSSGGLFHACLVEYGGVSCWGRNLEGQLGGTPHNGALEHVVPAGMDKGVSAVGTRGYFSCAIKNGGAWCWGQNNFGQLGNGTTDDSAVPVPVSGLSSGVTAIMPGFHHACAIKDGGAWCWGANGSGRLGDGTIEDSPVPVQVSGLTSGVTALTALTSHTCAIKDGGAWCWGLNFVGQLGTGNTNGSFVPVAVSGLGAGVSDITAGTFHTCAIQNGAAKCWGDNGSGRLGDGTMTGRLTPVAVTGMTAGVTSITTGDAHSCAVKGGAVSCWGSNFTATLGNGTKDDSALPVAASVPGGARGVSASSGHTCALGNAVYCWGRNPYGELGDGTMTERLVPTAATADNDGDGCLNHPETGGDESFGGRRDPMEYFDFFDVTGDVSVDLADALAVLARFGATPGDANYLVTYDRVSGPVGEPWRTAAATEPADLGIDLQDALVSLQSFGHNCTVDPN